MICVEELSPSSSDVVIFTLCQECEEVYCRRCLEEWLNKYERSCPRCKRADKRILRRSTPIACGLQRLKELMKKSSAEVEPPMVAPEPGELRKLAEKMVDPSFKRKRQEEDREEESLALAMKLVEDEKLEEERDEEFARILQRKEEEERRREQEREAKDVEFARALAAKIQRDSQRPVERPSTRRSTQSPLLSMFQKKKKIRSTSPV